MLKRLCLLTVIFLACIFNAQGGNAGPLLKKGWAALVKDNDTAAIACFEMAYEAAVKEKDTEHTAESLLNLGICYFGVSQSKGLEYCFAAMGEYKKLEARDPAKAFVGRCRCLQLVSTIYSRQGKYKQAIALSREAMAGFAPGDSSGYLGLACSSIGSAYARLNMPDSSEFYHRKALAAQLAAGNFVYLPGAYVKVADIELKKARRESRGLYRKAFHIADSSGNKQAQVIALAGLGKWHKTFAGKDSSEFYYQAAKKVAGNLRDKSFYLRVLQELLSLRKEQGNYGEALAYTEEIAALKDSMDSFDRHKLAKSLEVQFNVAEKDRKLLLLQQENNIASLSNYLLWVTIAFIIIISGGIILIMRRNSTRDKQLLQTKEALVTALEEQKNIREKYLQNELEFKESQLSAMALQILQKNELMQEFRKKLEENEQVPRDLDFGKILNKGSNYDKEWNDFNAYFESVNKNFYNRLKQTYQDISPNDLKICALIKLNLSIKEMAGILNISPDSVKTARYRLRKKLQLNTEDNLTEFILNL